MADIKNQPGGKNKQNNWNMIKPYSYHVDSYAYSYSITFLNYGVYT